MRFYIYRKIRGRSNNKSFTIAKGTRAFLEKGVWEMTKGEAKAFETDAVIVPIKFEETEENTILYRETTEQTIVESESNRINLSLRFARLKKSLRKRSVSIL